LAFGKLTSKNCQTQLAPDSGHHRNSPVPHQSRRCGGHYSGRHSVYRAVRYAEALIAAAEMGDPEVMHEVDVPEISRTRMMELGI